MSKRPSMKPVSIAVCLLALCSCALAATLVPSTALAAGSGPAWSVTAIPQPTNFAPGDSSGSDTYQVTAANSGTAATDQSAITITTVLPAGITLAPAGATATDTAGNTITCTGTHAVTCSDPDRSAIQTGGTILITIPVDVSAGTASDVAADVTVTGGGAAGAASASASTTISSAAPSFGIQRGSTQFTLSTTQAGAHPNVTTAFSLNTVLAVVDGQLQIIPQGNPKDIEVSLPPGLVGDVQAFSSCTADEIRAATCPVDAQVGVANLDLKGFRHKLIPVYNMVRLAGDPATLGILLPSGGLVQSIDVNVRSDNDYGVSADLNEISEALPIYSASVTLWGVPADPSHDNQRQVFGETGVFGASSSAALVPFMTNPTACGAQLTATFTADSWQNPGVSDTEAAANPGITRCDELTFDPSLTVQPDTTVADSPAGVTADLSVPQNQNPDSLATPELQNATVTLPAGVTLSPTIADGLQGCTAAEIALNSTAPATCPDASQIGTVQITTPLLPDPLSGQIFLGTPGCSPCTNADAADGNMAHGYIQAQADGVIVKLPGTFTLNTTTGQITAHFDNNPQLPFSDLQLDFKGGPRGVIATPEDCGTYTSGYDLQPWSSPFTADAIGSDSFSITSGCVSGFSPTFTAGVTNPQAGRFSPFVLSLSRADTDQELSGLSVTLPEGMLAKLAGIPLCSDSDANAGTCPASSQVGTVEVGSGPGPQPFFLPGKVYLTGAYKGGQYGLAVVVPAVAGPFDLGTVVVRQAIHIDPETAQVSVTSDPFPTILDGIPLRIRRIDVDLNRPDFTVAPTSCDPMAVTGTLTSTGGLSENVSSRFQVGGCQDIGFSPRLAIALTGKGKTRSGDHPTLTATLRPRSGQANIKTARVALPLSLALDPNNSEHVCSFDVARAVHGGAVGCPASTIVGSASVQTPLLSEPLTGPVYLVQGIRFGKNGQRIRTLPSLLLPLRGQIALDLRAQTSVSGGKLVTTFASVPDAPVSTFTLRLNGGKKGILVITGRGRSICTAKQVANADLGAQSGKTTTQKMTLTTPCGTPARLQVLSHRIAGRSLVVRVRASERGRLTLTGRGLRRISRSVSAGVHQLRVAVANKKRRGTIAVKLTLTPANARPATRTFTVRR